MHSWSFNASNVHGDMKQQTVFHHHYHSFLLSEVNKSYKNESFRITFKWKDHVCPELFLVFRRTTCVHKNTTQWDARAHWIWYKKVNVKRHPEQNEYLFYSGTIMRCNIRKKILSLFFVKAVENVQTNINSRIKIYFSEKILFTKIVEFHERDFIWSCIFLIIFQFQVLFKRVFLSVWCFSLVSVHSFHRETRKKGNYCDFSYWFQSLCKLGNVSETRRCLSLLVLMCVSNVFEWFFINFISHAIVHCVVDKVIRFYLTKGITAIHIYRNERI